MSETKEIHNTVSSASLIGATAFLGAIFGFVLQLLVAKYYGASAQTDAYFMALSTSELLNKLLMGGSITAVFLPLFIERLAKGRQEEAWKLGLNLIHLLGALFLILIAVISIFANQFVIFIAPGFDEATRALTVSLLRVLAPSFLILFLVDMAVSMLHSYRKFAIPALLRIVAPSASIISIILLTKPLGIYALAIGSVAGALLQMFLVIWKLWQQGWRYQFIFNPKDPAVARVVQLVYPFIFSMLITQGAGIVYRVLVSNLEPGSLSALKYAEKITQFLTIVFINSVTIVLYPLLSDKASRNDYSGMRESLGSAIRTTLLVTVPITVGAMILREPLIALAYQHGSFSVEAARLTSIALFFLVIGLVTNTVSSILGHAVLALQETKAAVLVTAASQVVAIVLFYLLVPYMAHAGLALASSLVPISSGVLYYLYLTKHIPDLKKTFLNVGYLKLVVLAFVLAATASWTYRYVTAWSIPESIRTIVQLIIPTVFGAIVFLGGAYLWRVPELHDVLEMAKNKFAKWRKVEAIKPEIENI